MKGPEGHLTKPRMAAFGWKMRILLVHQNFPGQFKHLGPALVARGDEVVAMGMRDLGDALKPDAQGRPSLWGMRYIRSQGRHNTTTSGHPWSRDFDSKVIRGAATLDSAIALKAEGFEPDVILAHPAWGEAMFLKEVWPDAPRITLLSKSRDQGWPDVVVLWRPWLRI
ncbi:MAG: hypothetical protein EOO77_26570 [Oxalobacteraceae bacterium]|nr:MAG: hypothetical protein EOO77_26570 [Oxalobacteraceae bacterium]